MKKFLSFFLALILSLSVFSTAAFASEMDYDKFLEKIEKTDKDINNHIEKAIDDADSLIMRYEDDLLKNMNDINASELESHISMVKGVLELLSGPKGQSDAISKKISNLEDKLNRISGKITSRNEELNAMILEYNSLASDSKERLELSKKIANRIEQLSKRSEKVSDRIEQLADKFNRDLDKIVIDLIDTTNEMAQKLILDGQKNGIEIESVWIEVGLGGRSILVDPCRTVSR